MKFKIHVFNNFVPEKIPGMRRQLQFVVNEQKYYGPDELSSLNLNVLVQELKPLMTRQLLLYQPRCAYIGISRQVIDVENKDLLRTSQLTDQHYAGVIALFLMSTSRYDNYKFSTYINRMEALTILDSGTTNFVNP